MKEVFYIRHAKSSWTESNLPDIDRPLNKRGLDAAEFMSNYVKNKYLFDKIQFISSPANRALSTAKIFAKALNILDESIKLEPTLYFGSDLNYIQSIGPINNDINTAFVFGHNPIIEHLVSKFDNSYIGHVPTCAVFYAVLSRDSWIVNNFNDFKLTNYHFPKMLMA